jgi:hypothetical protein
VLLAGDAVRYAVRIHVGEPEDRRRHDDEDGDAAGIVGIGPRTCDQDGEHDDRPVDEAAEPLAHHRRAELAEPCELPLPEHGGHHRVRGGGAGQARL